VAAAAVWLVWLRSLMLITGKSENANDMNVSDLKELDKKKVKLLTSMTEYMNTAREGFNAGYTSEDINACEKILGSSLAACKNWVPIPHHQKFWSASKMLSWS
jgi:hypothetical protein